MAMATGLALNALALAAKKEMLKKLKMDAILALVTAMATGLAPRKPALQHPARKATPRKPTMVATHALVMAADGRALKRLASLLVLVMLVVALAPTALLFVQDQNVCLVIANAKLDNNGITKTANVKVLPLALLN